MAAIPKEKGDDILEIELYIDGQMKTFTVPFVPMMAKRRYLEIQEKAEENNEEMTTSQQIEEDNQLISILSDIVFKNQFTVEDVISGASQEYVYGKIFEAVFGVKKDEEKPAEENADQQV